MTASMSGVKADAPAGAYTVAEATVDALLRAGVETVFGIGGTHTLPLLGAMERSAGLTFVAARTELGAAYMAVGFARASGRPAVALTSTGPGALNALAALQDACWSTLPLIHLTTTIGGGPDAGFSGEVHETPAQSELMRLAGKGCVRMVPAQAYEAVYEAVRLATEHPRGPVTLEIPAGCWREPVSRPADFSAGVEHRRQVPTACRGVGETGLVDLEDALRGARHPLFFVGGGALAHDGGAAVRALAEHLGAPLITSYQGKAIADWTHPLYLGPWASERVVRDIVGQADVAVAFGSKLSALGTAGWQLPLPASTYRVDLNGRSHPRYPTLGEVPADAATVAIHLRERLDVRDPWAADEVARAQVHVLAGARERSSVAMEYLDAIAAPELLTADMSKAGFWAMKFLAVESPAVQAFSSYLAMGTALPMAIGMAVARGRPVTVVVGDGGLQMSLAELATVAEYELPVTLMVIVDGAYGMLRDNSLAVGGSVDVGVSLWNPDLAALAGSFGIQHFDVNSPADLASVLARDSDDPRFLSVHDVFPRNW